ncbi:MAG TPA: hypothetical protein VGO58_13830 [Chitinophagaceae bacterium]|jgi:hypothetical protein|nr:hypothetical protein [Chitinophagaceae bacterium]
MENRFNNNDFEHFVKQNADQYRMFPSDKVWKGIHNTLHTRRRWYGIGLALLLLTTGVVTWVMLTPSARNNQVADTLPEVPLRPQVIKEKIQPARVAIVPARSVTSKTSFTISTDNLPENVFAVNNNTGTETGTITETPAIAVMEIFVTDNPVPVTKVEPAHYPESIIKTSPATRLIASNNRSSGAAPHALSVPVNNYSFSPAKTQESKQPAAVADKEEKTNVKESLYPYTIESVINSYTRITKRKRVSLQVYITPTISYRELKENKPYIDYARNTTNGASTAFYSVDINNVVTHKPDMGLQLGFTAGYPLSKKVKLIGGFQFNISKYDIKAYDHASEFATITLSTADGGSKSVSTLTNYRNTGGSAGANWLHNLYFSVSAPIGLELKLAGNRKGYLGVSGTIQPTYILSNRAYLISSDYKNYAEVPSLIRKWNINTGFEMFAGYSTGKVNWRIGPQVRYQAMSSFETKYPIKEHLFDFGLKLGVMLNK